ncbi:MAG: L,D-transpeptidase family protein [Candidatus Omnitrophica bacterium]|nr:L,D-transpeptidase family protein [Candidatus Omnitrophota bacterium]
MRNHHIYKQVLILVLAVLITGCGSSNGKGIKFGASAVDTLYAQAQALVSQGKFLEAKTAYEQITNDHTDYKEIEKVQQELYALNMKILFSNIPTPQTVSHEVVVGDTLGKLSKQYNVAMDLIKTCNNMQSETIRVGQKLRIWTGKFSIYVSKSQNFLMLKSNDDVLKVYSVSTGANNSTPVGTFKVTTKLENPVWFKAGAVIPPESPENVLGTRWLGFDKEGYGIHGTVDPDKIGQQVTAGCVRMRNEEVEELYKIVPRGTEVTIVD